MSIAREGSYSEPKGYGNAVARPNSVAGGLLFALMFPLTLGLFLIAIAGHWLRLWR